ncbi:hypothetical protein OEZ86_007881 [Tetradesmus obliquus]|uniref:Uncharacterized protein n=2 Tax=Tetradesmus obliquus TaxID=3088 RepID=A0A383VAW6_TETOB|nr:hypothetical protein OEZ85_013087 [Tetradesmus obliquus]WIA36592.1 hypothetical protein OEZ86_007881 [Tetradesmus obliquus]|eukprot:jgi/Sobl393_1/6620/SZX61902.1
MLASRTCRLNTTRSTASAGARAICPLRSPALQQRRCVAARGLGKDVVEGWLDLAKLVASEGSKAKSPYEELAYQIGRDVYVDIAGWHLFLRDMSAVPGLKMSQALATKLGPEVAGSRRGLLESDVAAVLKKIPVELGAGKTRVSLFEVMPSMCVSDLVKILDDYARNA